jgi:O-methyltransferase
MLISRVWTSFELFDVPKAEKRRRLDISSSLQRAIQYAMGSRVDGDIVEFGTASGFTASVIARTMVEIKRKPRRTLWLFDSFEGLPEATSDTDLSNPHVKTGLWGKGMLTGISPEVLQKRVSSFLDPKLVRVEKGWFSDSVKRIPDDTRFAMIHVDCDLYQSTIDCLHPLFSRKLISQGCVIVFDDWNCGRANNQLGERRAWREIAHEYNVEFEDFGHQSWAGRSFIVHSYG